jgi:hypothetical protein
VGNGTITMLEHFPISMVFLLYEYICGQWHNHSTEVFPHINGLSPVWTLSTFVGNGKTRQIEAFSPPHKLSSFCMNRFVGILPIGMDFLLYKYIHVQWYNHFVWYEMFYQLFTWIVYPEKINLQPYG